MSTGVVMDDMTYYYDTQYPKLRSVLEATRTNGLPHRRHRVEQHHDV